MYKDDKLTGYFKMGGDRWDLGKYNVYSVYKKKEMTSPWGNPCCQINPLHGAPVTHEELSYMVHPDGGYRTVET